MKIKTSELIGPALDWAVETIEIERMQGNGEHVKSWWIDERQTDPSPYSTDWLRAGEIIEREFICINGDDGNGTKSNWDAEIFNDGITKASGPTPLVAAMRCFCASKLGDEIDVPDELCTSPS